MKTIAILLLTLSALALASCTTTTAPDGTKTTKPDYKAIQMLSDTAMDAYDRYQQRADRQPLVSADEKQIKSLVK